MLAKAASPITPSVAHAAFDAQRATLAAQYRVARAHSLALVAPLSAEDQCVQSMPDASPTKWHLAHATWFFETLILCPFARPQGEAYRAFDEQFFYLFNSYYEALGPRHPRPARGVLTRPSLGEVMAYRAHVDTAMEDFIAQADASALQAALPLVTLGLHHEQQHQELLLTDILHAFSCNPLLPSYLPSDHPQSGPQPHHALESLLSGHGSAKVLPLRPATWVPAKRWLDMPEQTLGIGHQAVQTGDPACGWDETAFAFDNETPRHQRLLSAYQLASGLVTCGDYAEFVADGGYRDPELWLSDGWAAVQTHRWPAPANWLAPGDSRAPASQWQVFGLQGVHPLDPVAPVSQLSFYEAAAYAHWAGARLPTEFEWEAAFDAPGITHMTGYVWQWTRSSYDPYPGFRPMTGAVSEYNGKFMVSQMVLRGSSLATPLGHTRPTYRNFFPPAARWQFSGIRLARDF